MSNIPLRVANPIERLQSWEGIASPYELAALLCKVLSVDASSLSALQEIVYGNIEPEGEEASKIWIKTNEPVGIGIPSTDGYKMIYQVPAGIPFLFLGKESNIPSYYRTLTEAEMENCGLSETDGNDAFWVIFNP